MHHKTVLALVQIAIEGMELGKPQVVHAVNAILKDRPTIVSTKTTEFILERLPNDSRQELKEHII